MPIQSCYLHRLAFTDYWIWKKKLKQTCCCSVAMLLWADFACWNANGSGFRCMDSNGSSSCMVSLVLHICLNLLGQADTVHERHLYVAINTIINGTSTATRRNNGMMGALSRRSSPQILKFQARGRFRSFCTLSEPTDTLQTMCARGICTLLSTGSSTEQHCQQRQEATV